MHQKFLALLKQKQYILPSFLFQVQKDLKMTDHELILLCILINDNGNAFDAKRIGELLSWPFTDVLDTINNLSEKGIIKLELRKTGNVREEFVNLNYFHEKVAFHMMNDRKSEKEENPSLFEMFEKEFGRTLSPMEYEIISKWCDGEFKEELILLALKEAVYNGVSNLRYIDRILYDWKKKGLQSKEQVEKERKNFQKKKEEKKEVFDYDWLNDKDE